MNIRNHLPKKTEEETIIAQAKVSKELWEMVNKKRLQFDLTWTELQEAMFKAFLDESEKKK